MPSTSNATNPHGISVTFEEQSHKYTSIINGLEFNYISVSTLASKYFPKFDADKIAPLSAKKLGITVEEVKAKWKKAGIDACKLGTKIHESCEDIILNRDLRNKPNDVHEELLMKYATETARKIKDRIEVLGVEKLVFNEKIKIAGTIDLFGKSKKDGSYLILDWKTNKSIDIENNYGEKGFGPTESLDDTNFNHYALQLGLYEFILKNTGYVDKNANFKRILIHITSEGPKFITLPDYSLIVKDIILTEILN